MLTAPLIVNTNTNPQALSPFASVLRGMDISGGMVEQYNKTARGLGLWPDRMYAVRGDLLADGESRHAEDLAGFDVAVMSMALHHVADPADMVRKLAARLAPGGSLVIVDWLLLDDRHRHSHSNGHGHGHGHRHGHGHGHSHGSMPSPNGQHPAAHTVTRHGFTEEEMRSMFAGAGLVDYAFRLHPERSKVPFGEDQQLFFARGKVAA